MKRRTIVATAVLAAFTVMPPCLGGAPLTLTLLKDKALAESKTPEGQAYLKQFFTNPWMLAMDSADEQCTAEYLRSPSLEDFEIGLVIGDNGYPSDALVSPDSEGMRCLADRLKSTGFARPPHEGFAIYMNFKRTDPGEMGRPSEPPEAHHLTATL